MEDLLSTVRSFAARDGITATALPSLTLLRASKPNHLNQGMLRPSFCMVVQGEKEILIGDRLTRYAEGSFVAAAVSMLTAGHIVRAEPQVPYYGICVNLELTDIASVGLATKVPPPAAGSSGPGAYVAKSTPELRDVLLRLVRLADKPDEAAALGPILTQELIYRLLVAENGHLLLGVDGTFGIAKAIEHIKGNYTQPLRVALLAEKASMSVSAFHRRFKTVTTLSPIQYQKRVRLLEARRMLLAGDLDAGMAALMVGYESPSQFSREYRRQFGLPPMQDIARLKDDPLRNPTRNR